MDSGRLRTDSSPSYFGMVQVTDGIGADGGPATALTAAVGGSGSLTGAAAEG